MVQAAERACSVGGGRQGSPANAKGGSLQPAGLEAPLTGTTPPSPTPPRPQSGTYGDIYNFPQTQYERALSKEELVDAEAAAAEEDALEAEAVAAAAEDEEEYFVEGDEDEDEDEEEEEEDDEEVRAVGVGPAGAQARARE